MLISIISTCFNEEENLLKNYQSLKNVMKLNHLKYEQICDNKSTDNSRKILTDIRMIKILNQFLIPKTMVHS